MEEGPRALAPSPQRRTTSTILPMVFGADAQGDLMPGARNAVRTCLGIQPGERVALIADEASAAVAASLEHALIERGARADCVLIESVTDRPLHAAPPPVLAALS